MEQNNNPFVGLRPFEIEDSLYYFGRNEQTKTLLRKLHQHHFVAVIGSSGSGKSSLIRAGVIPQLEAGFLVQDCDQWLIAKMKPGETPLNNLITSLSTPSNENDDRISDSAIQQNLPPSKSLSDGANADPTYLEGSEQTKLSEAIQEQGTQALLDHCFRISSFDRCNICKVVLIGWHN